MSVARRHVLPALLFGAVACASTPTPNPGAGAQITAHDTVDFIVLGRGIRADCGQRTDASFCRIRDNVSIPEIRSRLASGTAAWQEREALVFAYEGKASAVDLTGTLDYPMSRVRGTDLWMVKLRIRDLDRAVISYAFVPFGTEPVVPGRGSVSTWRGPHAPREALRSARLQGRVLAESIDSRSLGSVRSVWVYVPPGDGPADAVLYLGDGRGVDGLAPFVDTLITAGTLPRLMLIGMANATPGPRDPPQSDPRALEYLWNYDTGNARFLAHERFLLDEVMPWAEARHGAPARRDQRGVFGISNSGGWAMQMGMRHPELFAHVIAFSPGGVRTGDMTLRARLTPPVRFLLLSGTLEPAFSEVARAWASALAAKQLEHRVIAVVAGHDWTVWCDHFGDAVQWAFGGSVR